MTGVELIAAERERQVSGEGWTARHDDRNDERELVRAALCYAGANLSQLSLYEEYSKNPNKEDYCPETWPWSAGEFNPSTPGTKEGQIRNLAKAGALIAAEIDRLGRTGE